ncbi:MAG: aminotransferase class V-fold PLP-dependent enzyme [Neisseriaceae bacterium]|nr:MAG: aminotransferase class V-fold PLP-dependent enzyme [Neisseriaceae bacterium]
MTQYLPFNNDFSISDIIMTVIREFYQHTDADDPVNFNRIENLFKSSTIKNDLLELEEYVQKLSQDILIHSTHLASPTFIGHMTSRLPNFIVQIAPLVVALNQNLIKTETSKGLTFQEKEMMAKIHHLIYNFNDVFYQKYIQDHSTSLGFFTSGGTISNITAIYTALNTSTNCTGSRLKYWLSQGFSDVVIIGSELSHYSFEKAADLLGLSFIKCSTNSQYQIDLNELNKLIKQCYLENKKIIALIGVAGTTDFGSVDDLSSLANIAKQENIHFHVDGAWGGAFIFSSTHRNKLLKGIEQADTVTLDGHKQLMLPLGSGMIFFKQPESVRQNIHCAPYAVRESSIDIGRFTIEGSRVANGLYLDAALRLLGQDGYERILKHSMKNTQYMVDKIITSDAFELIFQPPMNILLYRYIPLQYRNKQLDENDNKMINQANILLQKTQKEKGRTFVSRTNKQTYLYPKQNIVLLRSVLFNPLTQTQHIDYVLQDQIDIAKELNLE